MDRIKHVLVWLQDNRLFANMFNHVTNVIFSDLKLNNTIHLLVSRAVWSIQFFPKRGQNGGGWGWVNEKLCQFREGARAFLSFFFGGGG